MAAHYGMDASTFPDIRCKFIKHGLVVKHVYLGLQVDANNAVFQEERLWPDGIIYYVLEDVYSELILPKS